jgi:hypothetical protein
LAARPVPETADFSEESPREPDVLAAGCRDAVFLPAFFNLSPSGCLTDMAVDPDKDSGFAAACHARAQPYNPPSFFWTF